MSPVMYLFMLVAVVAAPLGALGTVPIYSGTIDQPANTTVEQAELDADRVLLRFDVREDGAAVARVEYRFALDESNNTTAFTRLQQAVMGNQTQYLERFERRVNRTVRTAENATGRPMRVTNATVRAETRQLPESYGVVVYTFTWHGFAQVENGELRVGDALAGLYLEEDTQLQISWPAEYEAQTVHDSVNERRDHAAIWVGPLWFDREGPRLVLGQDGLPVEPIPVALLGLSVLFAGSGLVLWWRAGRSNDDGRPAPTPVGSQSTDSDGGQSVETASDMAVEPELMSNEERILWEINQRNGRVKQQELVEALDWSDAKVSRAVSALRERGAIERIRIGNENLLSVPADGEEES